jgi:hypothetical protein
MTYYLIVHFHFIGDHGLLIISDFIKFLTIERHAIFIFKAIFVEIYSKVKIKR